MYCQPRRQILDVWCPCYRIRYLVMSSVDTAFIRQVEKEPMQVGPEGLASYSFSIRPEQSLEEASIRNRTAVYPPAFGFQQIHYFLNLLILLITTDWTEELVLAQKSIIALMAPASTLPPSVPRRLAQAVGEKRKGEWRLGEKGEWIAEEQAGWVRRKAGWWGEGWMVRNRPVL